MNDMLNYDKVCYTWSRLSLKIFKKKIKIEKNKISKIKKKKRNVAYFGELWRNGS